MDEENRLKITLWLKPGIVRRMDGWLEEDNCKSRGEFAEKALRFYMGYLATEDMEFLLNGTYPVANSREMEPPKPFALPPPHQNMRRVYAYLMKQRQIDGAIITHFARKGLLYEDAQYHNCVFVGTDERGVPLHAHKRSTNSRGKSFKVNVEGSRPQYSFHHVGRDNLLYVFEAPIDMLSFLTLYSDDWQAHSYVALCGTGGQAMHWMLEQNQHLRDVVLCLDNDGPGQSAAKRLQTELQEGGYRANPIGDRPYSVKMAGQSNLPNCNLDRWNEGVTP